MIYGSHKREWSKCGAVSTWKKRKRKRERERLSIADRHMKGRRVLRNLSYHVHTFLSFLFFCFLLISLLFTLTNTRQLKLVKSALQIYFSCFVFQYDFLMFYVTHYINTPGILWVIEFPPWMDEQKKDLRSEKKRK